MRSLTNRRIVIISDESHGGLKRCIGRFNCIQTVADTRIFIGQLKFDVDGAQMHRDEGVLMLGYEYVQQKIGLTLPLVSME